MEDVGFYRQPAVQYCICLEKEGEVYVLLGKVQAYIVFIKRGGGGENIQISSQGNAWIT